VSGLADVVGAAPAEWLGRAVALATTTSGPMIAVGVALLGIARIRDARPDVASQ
jgi:hypothetical protein